MALKVNRRGVWLAVLLFLAAGRAAHAQTDAPAQSLKQLRGQMEAYVSQPRFAAAAWGVKVVSLTTGRTVFDYHADRLLSPASNTKLYTAALGLDVLGVNYQFATPLYAVGKISRSGTLHGHLVVVGHGDPSWNERRLGPDFWTAFDPFLTLVTNAGIRRIDGNVIADATYFRGPPTGSSWTIDDLAEGEAGLISAVSLNDNLARILVEPGAEPGACCRLTLVQPGTGLSCSNEMVTAATDAPARIELFRPLYAQAVYVLGELPVGSPARTLSVAVPQPAAWFARAFTLALARRGIAVSGQGIGVAWPDTATNLWNNLARRQLGTVFSPPLREVVRDFMKPSQNLEADLLLATVGETTRGSAAPPSQTSEEAGLEALQWFLATAGVAPGDVRFDEASGLSRNNLTTANATVALLRFMAGHPAARDFAAALPVAGVDGTLRSRFHNTAAAGNLTAKTGTLRWADALSGYLTTAAGEHLAFSILLNRFAGPPGHAAHEAIDPLAVMLANFAGRSDSSPANQ